MRTWALALGGMGVWAVHFAGVYAIASVFDVIAEAEAPGARLWTAGLTVACILADAAIALLIRRRRRADVRGGPEDWLLTLGGLGAGFSFVAVLWQGLPALLA